MGMAYTNHVNNSARIAGGYTKHFVRLQSEAIERLSSGERDNSSLRSIGGHFRNEQRALSIASDTIASASGLLKTLQSGIFSIQDTLTATRGLAARVSTGGMSATELSVAQQEFSALLKSIDLISKSSTYKGRSILYNPGSVAFVGDNSVKPVNSGASTRGFISYDPATDGAASINISRSNGHLDVEIGLGDLKLTGTTEGLGQGDELFLTAADGYTRYSHVLTAAPNSVAALTTALTNVFSNAVAVGADATVTAPNLTHTGTGFTAVNSADISGFIDGSVTHVRATAASAGRFNIFVALDSGQRLVAYNADVNDFQLVDEADPANSIRMGGSASTTMSDVSNDLYTFFNVNSANSAHFSAGVAAYDPTQSYNGFDHHTSLAAVGGAREGKYAFSYDALTQRFKLTGGGMSVSLRASGQERQSLTFGNGLTIRIGSAESPFSINSDINPIIFTVESVERSEFEVGITPNVKQEIELTRVNTETLGIAGASIGTRDDAKRAVQSLEAAIAATSVLLARTGGQQRWAEAIGENVANLSDANREAANLYMNVDLAQELANYSDYQTKAATATYAFSDSISSGQRILDIIIS